MKKGKALQAEAVWEGGRVCVCVVCVPQRDCGWKGRQGPLREGLNKDKEMGLSFRGWRDTEIVR